MVKMQFTNNQTAFEYAIYMIVGSYLKKAKCSSPITEQNMRLQYCEQRVDNQYLMERICIRYAVRVLAGSLPKDFWKEEATVRFFHNAEDDMDEVQFITDKYLLVMRGYYRGKKSVLAHKFCVR